MTCVPEEVIIVITFANQLCFSFYKQHLNTHTHTHTHTHTCSACYFKLHNINFTSLRITSFKTCRFYSRVKLLFSVSTRRKMKEGEGEERKGEKKGEDIRLYRVCCSSYSRYNVTPATLQSDNICMQSFTSCPAPCSSSFMHFQFASEETVSTSSITVAESSPSTELSPRTPVRLRLAIEKCF